jgi:hypothetical protein
MNSKERAIKNSLNFNDIIIGFLFLATGSLFLSNYINAQMSDKSIYNSSQHLAQSSISTKD